MILLAMTGTGLAQSRGSLDKRLTLVEHKLDSAALGEMANQMEALRQQMQNLRGEIEKMQRQFQEIKGRQRDIYSDVDSRLRELEQSGTDPSAAKAPKQAPGDKRHSADGATDHGTPSNGGARQKKDQATGRDQTTRQSSNATDSTKEQTAYERAFNTLRDGQYARSQQEFHEFLRHYPDSQYADNARYWLAESYYVERHFDQAKEQFQKLLDDFPHSGKRPGAQLKIGFIQHEQGKLDRARKTLGEVIQRYPNSTAANLAQQRLRLIGNERQ
ncbi:MAG: tol-pal system protein YbgF [Nitrococcus mobilis]|nr:tol-pal system protein YbgF [Nitrococcus mobilis]